MKHDWPGNVRELENLLQRTLILLHGNTVAARDLAFERNETTAGADAPDSDLQDGLRHREYQLIVDALRANGGKRAAVAEALGVSPRTLRYKLARMRDEGIVIPGESNDATETNGTTGGAS